ncbi:hypothetical protein [Chitinophaga rhizophila]|uniref:Uncharacterized protein n=1 Tax=Chitinophaga rhizophila TaxID=2866212 RepID=A0ABS7GCR9_9BACT|nr:hypothetical protein [Chitinophaga rhizophila]MBW8684950.1 hypothetical protein [Chitinophaga rhizophila]
MKYLSLISAFILCCLCSYAQLKTDAQSESFKEKKSLSIKKVLLLKDGNTFYLSLSKKTMAVRIYNANHSLKTIQESKAPAGKGSAFRIIGMYEMNKDITMLLSTIVDHQIILKRLIFDGSTGILKEETKIDEMLKIPSIANIGLGFNVPEPNFFSEAMPEGNGYAIATMNSFEQDRSKRLYVTVYGLDNTLLSRAYFKTTDERYKYIRYIGLLPLEKSKLGIAAYGYNTRSSGDKECALLFGTLIAGENHLTVAELQSSLAPPHYSLVKYNPKSNKIMLLTKEYLADITASIIDPVKNSIFTKPLMPDKTTNKKSYNDRALRLENVFANDDGNFTIAYEHFWHHLIVGTPGSQGSSRHFRLDYTLSTLSVDKLTELESYTIPKRWEVPNNSINSLDVPHAAIDLELAYKHMSAMESFNFLEANGKKYFFLNETPENIARGQAEKSLKIRRSLQECDAYVFTLSGNKKVPPAKPFFSRSAIGIDNLGMFKTYDYDSLKNKYVVVKAEQLGKKKSWRIVWMTPS